MTPIFGTILQFRTSQHRGHVPHRAVAGGSGALRAAAGGGLLEPDEGAPQLNFRRPLTITSGSAIPDGGVDLDDHLLPPLGMTVWATVGVSINGVPTGVVGVHVGTVVCMVSGIRAHVVAGPPAAVLPGTPS